MAIVSPPASAVRRAVPRLGRRVRARRALFLFVTLGLGVFISTVSQTQGQAIQLAIMTLLPQVLLCGLFFPLSAMPSACAGSPTAAADLLHQDRPRRDGARSSRSPRSGSPSSCWPSSPRSCRRSRCCASARSWRRAGPPPRGAARRPRPGRVSWGVEHLSVRFGRRVALDDVTLAARPAQSPRSSAATAPARPRSCAALAGALRPDAGTVRRPEARRIGYVPARPRVYETSPWRENLEFIRPGLRDTAARRRAATVDYLDGRAGRGAGPAGRRPLGRHAPKLAFAAVLPEPPCSCSTSPRPASTR